MLGIWCLVIGHLSPLMLEKGGRENEATPKNSVIVVKTQLMTTPPTLSAKYFSKTILTVQPTRTKLQRYAYKQNERTSNTITIIFACVAAVIIYFFLKLGSC